MSAQVILNAIDIVAEALPFHLNDYDRVNEAFAACSAVESTEHRSQVDVWTYCFVSRYFALRFLRSGRASWSDLDRLIDKAFIKIRRGSTNLRAPGKYTSWVSTVCRNSYLNYVRSYQFERLTDPEGIVAESEEGELYDLGLLAETLSEAINDLPPFLRETARFRFVTGLTYGEISARTGQSVPTARAYANKSIKLIRKHPHLRRILNEILP